MIGACVLLLLLVLLAVRLLCCLPGHKSRPTRPTSSLDILVVLGSGGHTGEMMPIVDSLSRWTHCRSITAVASSTDRLSLLHPLLPPACAKISIPRSREVGQSYFSSFFTTFLAFLSSLKLIVKRPDVLVVNGPGVCVPVVLSLFLGNLIGLTDCSIVFIESFCRVTSLSLTGKIIYPLCDLFFVCWPELIKVRTRARLLDQFGLFKTKHD
jgi:beta-1,4-N-acetylglucosaminyltransferase